MALVSGLIGLICSETLWIADFLSQVIIRESAYFGGLSFIVSFVVVYRAQLAIQRYNASQATYFRMSSKIADMGMMFSVWLNDTSEEKRDDKTRRTGLLKSVLRWLQLYHELGTEEIQGFDFSALYPRTKLTTEEALLLTKTVKRPVVVMSWILNAVSKNKSHFSCDGITLSRIYVLASEANESFNETRRVSETPFPFPFAQITMMMISLWAIATPIVISPVFTGSYVGAGSIAFFGTWVLFAVNEAASQLEQPFDDAANDLPVLYYSLCFQDEISAMLNLECPSVEVSSSLYKKTNKEKPPTKVSDKALEEFTRIHAFKKSFKPRKQKSFNNEERNWSKLYGMFNIPVASSATQEIKKASSSNAVLNETLNQLTLKTKPAFMSKDRRNVSDLTWKKQVVWNSGATKIKGRTYSQPVVEQKKKVKDDKYMSNTLTGATSDAMLMNFRLENKNRWRDYALLVKSLEQNPKRLLRRNSSVHNSPLDLHKKLKWNWGWFKPTKVNKIAIDERSPFSLLRRQGVFDRVR